MSISNQDILLKCRTICAEVKENILSSEDIIPHQKLPFFVKDYQPQYIKQFGESAVLLYLKHISYLKYIRDSVEEVFDDQSCKKFIFELAKQNFPINKTLYLTIPCILSIANYGVGACHELALSAWINLLEQNCSASLVVISDGERHAHCLVLVGNIQLEIGNAISTFNDYADDVLIVDPLMNYVGPANQYLRSQQDYLIHYDYKNIISVLNISSEDLNFYKKVTAEVIQRLDAKNLEKFIFEPNLPHETATLQKLNDTSSLKFFGNVEKDLRVNALCPISNDTSRQSAVSLMKSLKAGVFMTFKSINYLVIPEINMPSETPDNPSLAEKIKSL